MFLADCSDRKKSFATSGEQATDFAESVGLESEGVFLE